MRHKIIFALAFLGIVAGAVASYIFGIEKPPQPPVFNPVSNPYAQGIYAEGIIESDQPNGENINVYPEVAGTVRQIFVTERQRLKKGTPLLLIDDSVQKATVEQLHSQAEAALAVLEELKAQPRKETLEVAASQVRSAAASLKSAEDTLRKQQTAYELNPRAISKDSLDSAANAAAVARANLEVAQKQYELTQAGAWIFDIRNLAGFGPSDRPWRRQFSTRDCVGPPSSSTRQLTIKPWQIIGKPCSQPFSNSKTIWQLSESSRRSSRNKIPQFNLPEEIWKKRRCGTPLESILI